MGKKHDTLEKHLNILGKTDPGAKGLESVYDLQKRKLVRYLSSVLTTFPTYSTHDTFHSVNIIVAIESILGSRRIKTLSGIDAFLILMCAYMHDIGMLYTEDEVRVLWKKEEFSTFLQDARHKNHEMEKAVSLVEGAMMPEGDGKKLWALGAPERDHPFDGILPLQAWTADRGSHQERGRWYRRSPAGGGLLSAGPHPEDNQFDFHGPYLEFPKNDGQSALGGFLQRGILPSQDDCLPAPDWRLVRFGQ